MDIRPLLKFNIPIIEDCAVALGSKIDSKYAGTIGNCTALSFYASKIITTGNGGMFISKNKDLVNKARDYRDFDGVKKYYPRFNFQITDIQAAIGVVQLSKIEKFLELRKEIAMIYKNICFKRGWDYQQPLKDNLYPNWFRFVVKMPEKRILKLKNYLKKRNIETVIPFKQATLLHNYLKLSSNDYPNSQILSTETLSLPIYPNIILSKNIKIIIKALENY
jgi:dTDP-4-amino-4,6-dideoxygalactose transaminase